MTEIEDLKHEIILDLEELLNITNSKMLINQKQFQTLIRKKIAKYSYNKCENCNSELDKEGNCIKCLEFIVLDQMDY